MDIDIELVPKPTSSNYDKGAFFESIIKKVLETQRYKITKNINFTGHEIDLLCKHLDRTDEVAYVECKDRINLASKDLTHFNFNVNDKKVNFGYFIYTRNFQHQVAGLIEEWGNKYSNLYFFAAPKVYELLVDSKYIKKLDVDPAIISKMKIALTYFGNFYIIIKGKGFVPEYFSVLDCHELKEINQSSVIDKLRKYIDEISQLKYEREDQIQDDHGIINDIIVEVQESESWYDFKPASSKHFVGRENIRQEFLDSFGKVIDNNTRNRLFYLNGNSGWGKSSFINELKGRCRNKYYKNKYFIFPVDSRAIESNYFVAKTFYSAIEKAAKEKFIPKQFINVSFTSSFDILSSKSVQELFSWLKSNKRLIIIVFDQFEDVFRKGDIFKPFYKFLLDVNDQQQNLIIGFSWKSETNIPIDHSAYSLWQQAKEFATEYRLTGFDYSESKAIVQQLEKGINKKLEADMINHIIFNSQGFPWLVKKLCVHVYNQYRTGISIEKIYEQDFNVKALFNADLNGISTLEIKALKLIAKRASENNFFDITEVDEKISENTIRELVNKRLLIKSGSKYNRLVGKLIFFIDLNESSKHHKHTRILYQRIHILYFEKHPRPLEVF